MFTRLTSLSIDVAISRDVPSRFHLGEGGVLQRFDQLRL